jgi:soluble lytic murein transglycosylase
MVRSLVFSALIAIVSACKQPPQTQALNSPATAQPEHAPGDAGHDGDRAAVASPDAGAPAGDSLRAIVQRGEWSLALRTLNALPEAERSKPEVRYLAARLAWETRDAKQCLVLLTDLERALPLLAEPARELRALAQLDVGEYAPAAEYFGKRTDVRSLTKAAFAFEQAGNVEAMKRAVAAALAKKGVHHADEVQLRSARLRMGSEFGAEDAKWLLVNAPKSLSPDGTLANAKLTKAGQAAKERLGAAPELDGEAWHKYAKTLVDEGFVEHALSLVPRIPRKLAGCAKGELLYRSRTRYLDASKAYTACASEHSEDAAEYLLLSARALSRADKDDEARLAYERLETRFPKSPSAAQAGFLRGRLAALSGHWAEAAQSLDRLQNVKESDTSLEQARIRAIAHLLAKDLKPAKALLTKLTGEGSLEERARATNLAALAAFQMGEKLAAIGLWSANFREHPLDYAGLVARARLKWAGVETELPASLVKASAVATVKLPDFVALLNSLGLSDEAEAALRSREGELSERSGGASVQGTCDAYGLLDRAERRYDLLAQIPKPLLLSLSASNAWAWECAYPRPYFEAVQTGSASSQVSSDLVYGVMRAESGFRAKVRSPVGAIGLLQLMPKTAEAIATRRSETLSENWKDDAYLNVRFGADYLGMLLRDLGHPALAAAAYNAGPEAITRWRKNMGEIDLDVFLELIPYAETRTYVSRVLSNTAHYAFLYNGETAIPEFKLDQRK